MKLQHLSDEVLHLETLKLVRSERETSVRILHHLSENDRRKLFSDHKCTSLFDYCVRVLRFSEASAQRRIVAARLINEMPELACEIEEGVHTLTNISLVNQFFRENKIKEHSERRKILGLVENLSKKECEKKLFELSGKVRQVRPIDERVSSTERHVSFVLSDETLAELEKLKALLGRDLTMDELVFYMARAGIEKVEKEKFKQTKKPRTVSPEKVESRIPGAAVKREVYLRDKVCVQCGSIHNLNFDHIEPWALGGESQTENMRLLCFHCNQRASIKVFGSKAKSHSPELLL